MHIYPIENRSFVFEPVNISLLKFNLNITNFVNSNFANSNFANSYFTNSNSADLQVYKHRIVCFVYSVIQ